MLHSNIFRGRNGNVVFVIFHYEVPAYVLSAYKPPICDGISLRNSFFSMPIDDDNWIFMGLSSIKLIHFLKISSVM